MVPLSSLSLELNFPLTWCVGQSPASPWEAWPRATANVPLVKQWDEAGRQGMGTLLYQVVKEGLLEEETFELRSS